MGGTFVSDTGGTFVSDTSGTFIVILSEKLLNTHVYDYEMDKYLKHELQKIKIELAYNPKKLYSSTVPSFKYSHSAYLMLVNEVGAEEASNILHEYIVDRFKNNNSKILEKWEKYKLILSNS